MVTLITIIIATTTMAMITMMIKITFQISHNKPIHMKTEEETTNQNLKHTQNLPEKKRQHI